MLRIKINELQKFIVMSLVIFLILPVAFAETRQNSDKENHFQAQAATGNDIVQVMTTGNNSPITIEFLNKSLREKLEGLEEREKQREWERASRLNYRGWLHSVYSGGEPLADMMEGSTRFIDKDHFDVICSQENMVRWEGVIKYDPLFVFPYFFISKCLYDNSLMGWKAYAEQAKKILEITTKIQGHIPEQESILEAVNAMLQTTGLGNVVDKEITEMLYKEKL